MDFWIPRIILVFPSLYLLLVSFSSTVLTCLLVISTAFHCFRQLQYYTIASICVQLTLLRERIVHNARTLSKFSEGNSRQITQWHVSESMLWRSSSPILFSGCWFSLWWWLVFQGCGWTEEGRYKTMILTVSKMQQFFLNKWFLDYCKLLISIVLQSWLWFFW